MPQKHSSRRQKGTDPKQKLKPKEITAQVAA